MADTLFNSLTTIATAIVGVAILAVLVSRNANTAGVLTSAGQAFSTSLQAATGPVTGGTGGVNLNGLMGSGAFGSNANSFGANTYF